MKVLCLAGLLEYDTSTGSMCWLVRRSNAVKLSTPIRQPKDLNNYPQVRVDGKLFLVHRLAWEALYGPIPPGMEINHINGIKNDNRLINLELVTHQQNMAHAKRTGLTPRSTVKERPLLAYNVNTGDGLYCRNSRAAKSLGFHNATSVAKGLRSSDKGWVFSYMEN